MNDIYIFFYVVNNYKFLYKHLKNVSVEKLADDFYIKIRYNFDVFKYYYRFCKEFEKEKHFYNIYIDSDVVVTLKVDKITGVIVNNIYTSGFIPDDLFFHINKKILAIGNGSQDYFYYLSFLYTL